MNQQEKEQLAVELKKYDTFIPARNWLGGTHKENGAYIDTKEGVLLLFKSEGYKLNTVKVSIKAINSMAHMTMFKFLFLVFVYSFTFIHAISIHDKNGGVFGMIALNAYSKENLHKLLQKLLQINPDISLDPGVDQFVKTQSMSLLNKKWYAAVFKGIIPWIIAIPIIVIIIAMVGGA